MPRLQGSVGRLVQASMPRCRFCFDDVFIRGFQRTNGTEVAKASVRYLDRCMEGGVGFFYLEGHGVPAESQQKMHQLAKEFFSLPAASKDCLVSVASDRCDMLMLLMRLACRRR